MQIFFVGKCDLHKDMRVCWNWQTGTFEGRVSYGVRVQVPSLAPKNHHIWWFFTFAMNFCYEFPAWSTPVFGLCPSELHLLPYCRCKKGIGDMVILSIAKLGKFPLSYEIASFNPCLMLSNTLMIDPSFLGSDDG